MYNTGLLNPGAVSGHFLVSMTKSLARNKLKEEAFILLTVLGVRSLMSGKAAGTGGAGCLILLPGSREEPGNGAGL